MADVAYAPSVPRTRPLPPGLLVFVGLAGAIVVGIAAAVNPVLAVAGVLGLAIVPVVLIRPIVGLTALVLMSFLEEVSGQTGALSVTKMLGALLLVSWLAFVMTSRGERRDGLLAREPLLVATIVLFVAWACMSVVWAEAPGLAQNSIQHFVLNFTLFPIALVAIRAPRHMIILVVTFVAGALIAAAWGINAGGLGDPETGGRLKGAGINANQLGSYLVVAMVFATALASNRRWSSLARATALSAAVLAAIGVFLTVSRGALVGMAVALLLAPFVVGAGRRARTVALILVAVIGVGAWYGAIAPASAVHRVTNPGGGSGREDIWRVGWRMVEDKPVHGVGAGNFPEASIHYLLRPGATDNDNFIIDDKKVAHNIYLTVLSELGVIGLLLFVLLVGLCLRAALRAARAFDRLGDSTMEVISRALFISLVSLLVVGFFSSALYVKQFWFLLALAPALLALAERTSAARAGRPGDFGSRVPRKPS